MNEIINSLRATCQKLGYRFFEDGDYNLNLIAVREDDRFDNRFSDKLYIAYKVGGIWKLETLEWTTLAGTLGFGGEQNPLTGAQTGTDLDGVAVMKEGQYRSAFKLVRNGWSYPFIKYIQQIREITYWRDNNRNGRIDRDTARMRIGNYATHIHAMSPPSVNSEFVNYWGGVWSQGCQGAPEPTFAKLFALCEEASKTWGNVFTYTLLHRNQIA
jgi:hypothetical protein